MKVIACPLKAECPFSSTRCFPANCFLGIHEKRTGASGHVHQLQADIFDVFSKRPREISSEKIAVLCVLYLGLLQTKTRCPSAHAFVLVGRYHMKKYVVNSI